MECGSCGAVIPDDSIFCSECGARQEFSRAGSFSAMGSQSLGGGEVTGGRGFGVVSGEAVRQQRDMQQQGMPQGIPADILQNIASGIQQQNNLPPGSQLPSAAAKPIPESNEQSIPSAATLHPTRPTNAARYADQFATKRYSTATTRTNYSKWCRSKHKRRIAAGQATWWYHGYQQSNSITDRCNGKPIG